MFFLVYFILEAVWGICWLFVAGIRSILRSWARLFGAVVSTGVAIGKPRTQQAGRSRSRSSHGRLV